MSEMTSELNPISKYEKMEITPFAEACDEREEGEIIEDGLEDVSDSSMFPNSPVDSGKSVSPELLSAVCLSSVSSTEYCRPFGRTYYDDSFTYNKWRQRRKRKDYNCKRRNGYTRHRKRVSVEVQSGSDNELVDPKYAKQLKEALKHETPQELHNSLRTRLKAFIDPIIPHSDEDSLSSLRDMALLSTLENTSPSTENKPNVEENNKNLIVENFEDSELYELRMAALKSVVLEKHKQRKRKKGDCSNAICSEEVDKENDQSIINNDLKTQEVCVEEGVLDKEVVAEVPQSENGVKRDDSVTEDDVDILRAMLLASMTKTLSAKYPVTTNDVANTSIDKQEFSNSEHKRTLAKHAIVNPLIININDDSDSDLDVFGEENKTFKETVTEFLKKQRAEVENVKKNESLNKSDEQLMDKSVLRLLPRSQQLEYRQLKQRLINARKKARLRKTSQRLSENATLVKKVPKVKILDVSGSSSAGVSVNGKVKSVQERKNVQPNLQKTLNELQIRKNGRLQMKGKYRSLGVLLHKINHASNVRRQHELEIKKLLHEIQKARVKLAMSHQNFTNLVQQLVKEKQVIDQRVYKSSVPFTSTPKRIVNKQLNVVNNTVESTSTYTPNEVEIAKEEEKVLLEPNDVTKVFVQQADVLKYTSPLDNRDRSEFSDPLTTYCPYDLLGTCKDKECKYVHCS